MNFLAFSVNVVERRGGEIWPQHSGLKITHVLEKISLVACCGSCCRLNHPEIVVHTVQSYMKMESLNFLSSAPGSPDQTIDVGPKGGKGVVEREKWIKTTAF
jgi:hypothetical protein